MNYPLFPRTKENAVECNVVNMTPELASHYLSNNPVNRPVSPRRVSQFAGMMSAGQWALNGETIVISATGRLLDGQHRLAAVVEHGGPVQMLVATGANDATFSTIDIGAKRSSGQIAGIHGIPNSNTVAAAAGILYRLFHGVKVASAVPAPYLLETIERYPSLSLWSNKARTCNTVISASALLAACAYLDAIAGRPDIADEMVEGLKTGENLSKGNPVLALRNRSIGFRGAAGNGRAVWLPLVRTMDAMEAGEPLTVIRSGASIYAMQQRPARFVAHTRHFTPHQRLADLLPGAHEIVQDRSVANAEAA